MLLRSLAEALRPCRTMAPHRLLLHGSSRAHRLACVAFHATHSHNAPAWCRHKTSQAAGHSSLPRGRASLLCPTTNSPTPARQHQHLCHARNAATKPGTSPVPPTPSHAASILKLVGVACLWGTYAPLVRLVFLQDAPPPASVLTAAQSCIGTALLLASSHLSTWLAPPDNSSLSSSPTEAAIPLSNPAATTDPEPEPLPAPHQPGQQQQQRWRQQQQPQWSLWAAGGEQGAWLFMGAACHTVGLTLASTTASSFLLQASAILTPALSTLTGNIVRAPLWLASALGFLGSLLIAHQAVTTAHTPPAGTDPAAQSGWLASVPAELAGLSITLVACVCYAASTVRLGVHCRRHLPLQLTAATNATYALLSLLWVAWDCWHTSGAVLGATLQLSWQVWAVIGWLAVGPGALSSFLQTDGQRGVDPATAQVIYLGTPLWASLIAALTMTGEGMDAVGWAGGSLILVGSCIAIASPAATAEDAKSTGQ